LNDDLLNLGGRTSRKDVPLGTRKDAATYLSCTHGNRYTLPTNVKEIVISYLEFKCGCAIKMHDSWIEYTEI